MRIVCVAVRVYGFLRGAVCVGCPADRLCAVNAFLSRVDRPLIRIIVYPVLAVAAMSVGCTSWQFHGYQGRAGPK